MTRTVRQAVSDRANVPAVVPRTDAIAQLVAAHERTIGDSLPTGMDVQRFTRLLLTATSSDPKLMQCDPRSFLVAAVTAAQLGLEPNDPRGLAYLLPFGNKVQLIIGYRGYIDLARRSGQVGAINAFVVYDGDQFAYTLGLDPTIVHVPNPDGDDDPQLMTHAYAVAELLNPHGPTSKQFVVLNHRQIEKARAQSRSADNRDSPWQKWPEAMWRKTAIRALAKMLPQTVELAHADSIEDRDMTLGDLATLAGNPQSPHLATDDDVIEATHEPDDSAEWDAAGYPEERDK